MQVFLLIVLLATAYLVYRHLHRWWISPITYRGVTRDELHEYLFWMMVTADPGSVMLAEYERGPGFLQVRLNEAYPEAVTLELGVPEMQWSRSFFESVRQRAETEGYYIRTDEVCESGSVTRFHHIEYTAELSNAREEATSFCRFAFEALETPSAATFSVVTRQTGGRRSWQYLHGVIEDAEAAEPNERRRKVLSSMKDYAEGTLRKLDD